MLCDEATVLVSAYIDGELDDSRRQTVAAHLASCAECRALAEDYRRQGQLLLAGGREPVPADLAARIHTQLALESPSASGARLASQPHRPWPARAGWSRRAAAMIAACMLSAAAGWTFADLANRRHDLASELLSAHIRSMLQDSQVQVATSDSHTVKPWFNGRLEFAPNPKDLTSDGFPLVGARLDYLGGRRVAALVYKRRLHVINVFVWPSATSGTTAPTASSVNGYSLLSWTSGGMSYAAVSDLNMDELRALQVLL